MINQFGLTIYTDGSARGNPGRGGYGAILIWNGKSKEVSQGFKHTTNNRMELMSVIAALESLTRTGLNIQVFSDSKYVVRAVSEKWLDNWIKTDFKGGKKNKDLWVRYHKLAQDHEIRFTWVKGHASNPYNQRCDELATTAADGGGLIGDVGYTS
jgi:ribonuclease HI